MTGWWIGWIVGTWPYLFADLVGLVAPIFNPDFNDLRTNSSFIQALNSESAAQPGAPAVEPVHTVEPVTLTSSVAMATVHART